jgi:hypothetical protein
MFQWVLKLLTAPILGSLVDGYKAKLAAGNDHDRIAADLAGRELQVQQKEIEAAGQLRVAQVGRWYEPEKIMGYTVAFFFAKLVVWDTALGLGTTPALRGWADTTATLIVGAYFGKRTVETALRIWRAK